VIKVFIAPRRYVQGVGVLQEIGKYVAPLGKRALVAWGPNVSGAFGDMIRQSFAEHSVQLISYVFSGECDRSQVAAGIEKARAGGADVVVGLGGGKAIDLGKAIAMGAGLRFASVPTIASNDAPTSAATVYYTCEGDFEGWDLWPVNPDLVLVDTQVIVNAPARWLVSGMGDGLCTWYEAEAAFKGRRTALAGGVATMAAINLARLCGDTIFEFGVDARRDCELHVVTPAVEKIVEANTLLSGLGFESGGVATAHAIGNGLTAVAKDFSHGERVAFGLAAQLCMDEDIPATERLRAVDFMIAVGLPVTLEELGLGDISNPQKAGAREKLMELATGFVGPGSIAHNHVFTVTPFDIFSAMIAADALGRERRALAGK
jgi:glycerol dehydrogenase